MPCQSQEALGLVDNWGDIICTPSNGEATATKADLNGNPADDRPLILLVDYSKIIHTFFGNALRESPYHLINAYGGCRRLSSSYRADARLDHKRHRHAAHERL